MEIFLFDIRLLRLISCCPFKDARIEWTFWETPFGLFAVIASTIRSLKWIRHYANHRPI